VLTGYLLSGFNRSVVDTGNGTTSSACEATMSQLHHHISPSPMTSQLFGPGRLTKILLQPMFVVLVVMGKDDASEGNVQMLVARCYTQLPCLGPPLGHDNDI
jgi:hypothetical protein